MFNKSNSQIEGNISNLNANLVNSNNFEGKKLTVKSCQVSTSESSDFSIHVVESITIDTSGSIDVYIYDNPAITLNKFTDQAKLHKSEL